MSSQPMGNAQAGWESSNGTPLESWRAPEGVTATPESPKHKVMKPRRRKSTQSNPPSVMSTSSSLHNSPENSPDERDHDRDRRPPQRPPVSQIGAGAVVPPMPPINGSPPINVTLVQVPPQESPSGRRRSSPQPQGDTPEQLPEASDSLDDSPEKAKLEARKIKAVGTLSEVVEASTAARRELLPFVSSELPTSVSLINAFQFGLATFNLRFVFFLCPFLKRFLKPFTREMINLGGLERGPTGQTWSSPLLPGAAALPQAPPPCRRSKGRQQCPRLAPYAGARCRESRPKRLPPRTALSRVAVGQLAPPPTPPPILSRRAAAHRHLALRHRRRRRHR